MGAFPNYVNTRAIRFLLPSVVLLATISLFGCDSRKKGVERVLIDSVKTAGRNARVMKSLQSALTSSNAPEVQPWHQFLAHWPDAPQRSGFAWREAMNRLDGHLAASSLVRD